MRIKKRLFLGVLISSVAAFANYIEDAAKMVNNGEMKISDLKKDFSMEEIKQIDAKSKELKISELKEKKKRKKSKRKKKKPKSLKRLETNKNKNQKTKF